MVYITDNMEIYNHVICQRHPTNIESEINLDVILKYQTELIFVVNDRSLKEDDISPFDISIHVFDISKNGCLPRIKKEDILVLKNGDNFSCTYF